MNTKRTRACSWDLFERRFNPITKPDGSLLWDTDEIPRPIVGRHWWTVLDCDGRLCVAAGFRFVNRLGYVQTERPWTDDDALIDYRYD